MEVFRFNNHVKVQHNQPNNQTQQTFHVNTTNNPKKPHPNLFHFHICVLKPTGGVDKVTMCLIILHPSKNQFHKPETQNCSFYFWTLSKTHLFFIFVVFDNPFILAHLNPKLELWSTPIPNRTFLLSNFIYNRYYSLQQKFSYLTLVQLQPLKLNFDYAIGSVFLYTWYTFFFFFLRITWYTLIGFSYIDFDVSSENIYYQLHQPNLYLLLLFLDEKPVLIKVTIFKISFTQKNIYI